MVRYLHGHSRKGGFRLDPSSALDHDLDVPGIRICWIGLDSTFPDGPSNCSGPEQATAQLTVVVVRPASSLAKSFSSGSDTNPSILKVQVVVVIVITAIVVSLATKRGYRQDKESSPPAARVSSLETLFQISAASFHTSVSGGTVSQYIVAYYTRLLLSRNPLFNLRCKRYAFGSRLSIAYCYDRQHDVTFRLC